MMSQSNGEPSVITDRRYTYIHDVKKGPPEAIDVHHIVVARNSARIHMLCKYAILLSIMCLVILLLLQEKSVANVLWVLTVAGFSLRQFTRMQIEKESVTIFPSFGVQLETVYRSGRTVCCFVPAGKILKPVLNECVTPVTCYWSLSLILRGEEELLLAFKGLYPPVTMLIPIWKALCAAIENENSIDVLQNATLDCDD